MLAPEQLDSFAAAFTVLGNLQLSPPEEETRAQVLSMLTEWPILGDEGSATGRGVAALRASGESSETADDIRRDQDLMYGITATVRVAPYESVHRSREGLVFDLETLEVRQVYRQMGLQAPRLNREPDDHIGLELNFLAHCCLSALTALEQGVDESAERYIAIASEFTRDHVNRWVPRMLIDAAEQADTRWLEGIEFLTLGALDEWNSALAEAGYEVEGA